MGRLLGQLLNKCGGRFPYSGTIEPTWRCNNNCVHCYCNLPVNDVEAKKKELSFKEMCRIIDELVELGCLWLLFTGGEPFVRKDFLDIYAYTKKKGIWVDIYTNATLITPKIADYLKKWPPKKVEITLYGATKETYEKVTRVPGSFERCMRGVQLLLKRNIRMELKMMVFDINKHELNQVRSMVKGWGVSFRYDAILNPRLDGSKNNLRFRLPAEEVTEFELEEKERLKAYRKKLLRSLGSYTNDLLHTCGAGRGTFQINPYGKLGGCALVRRPDYDLRKGSFREAWYEVFPRMLEEKKTRTTKCTKCQIISLCSVCSASSLLETGDAEEPVDYYCQIAHLKWEELKRFLKIREKEVKSYG